MDKTFDLCADRLDKCQLVSVDRVGIPVFAMAKQTRVSAAEGGKLKQFAIFIVGGSHAILTIENYSCKKMVIHKTMRSVRRVFIREMFE